MATNAKNLAELLNTDSTVAVGDIADGSVTTAKLAADAVTAAKLADNAVVTANVADGAVTAVKTTGVGKNKNILYNGAMQIYQRGQQTTSAGANTYFVDRFNVYIAATAAATCSQSTDVPTGQGFTRSAVINVTTADTSIGATDLNLFRQPLEGNDLQHLCYGSSNAKQLTLSFWVKSPKTGTHICELYNAAAAGARQVSKAYTISSANTWEFKSITFDGDTTRAFDNGTNPEMYVQWVLTAGTNFTSGTLNTSWADVTEANRYVGQVNIFDNTSNNFYITGAQLEIGATNTDFEHLPFTQEQMLCRRYYQINYATWYGVAAATGYFTSETIFYVPPLRANPAVAQHSFSSGSGGRFTVTGATSSTINGTSVYSSPTSAGGNSGWAATWSADAEM